MATQADKTNTPVIATIVVVGALSMIAISAMLAALARSERAALDERQSLHADLETIAELRGAQTASLMAAAHWQDKAKGMVAIPIDRAMSLVLDEYRGDPRAASPPPPEGMVLEVEAGADPGAGSDPGVAAAATEPGESPPIPGAPKETTP